MRLLCGSFALCWFGVALAYAETGAKTFAKKSDGVLALWSALFWPLHVINTLTLYLFRRRAKENAFDLINDSILLSCKLNSKDQAVLQNHKVSAVLDVTCEFSETSFLRALNYRSISVLNTCTPTIEQLREGAQFIEESAKDGGVSFTARSVTGEVRCLCSLLDTIGTRLKR